MCVARALIHWHHMHQHSSTAGGTEQITCCLTAKLGNGSCCLALASMLQQQAHSQLCSPPGHPRCCCCAWPWAPV